MSKITTLIKLIESSGIEIAHFQSASVLSLGDKVSVIYCNCKDTMDLVVNHYASRDDYTSGVTNEPMVPTNDYNYALLAAAEYLIGE